MGVGERREVGVGERREVGVGGGGKGSFLVALSFEKRQSDDVDFQWFVCFTIDPYFRFIS